MSTVQEPCNADFCNECEGSTCWCLTKEPDDIQIRNVGTTIRIPTSSVVVKDAIILVSDGKTYSLDASYDFANLPTKLHAVVMNLIMKRHQLS